MKEWLIVYSSNTGNTEKIAKAMYSALDEENADIFSVHQLADDFDFSKYEIILVGYWLTRGGPDKGIQAILGKIKSKQVVLFETHGAMPGSEHVVTAFARAALHLGEGCSILATFSSQGKINPALLARRRNSDPNDPHSATPRNQKRWEEASKHPNEEDEARAREFVGEIKHKLELRQRYLAAKKA